MYGVHWCQGQIWGRAALDWAELQEPVAMLDAAAVGMGTRVLDAGCRRRGRRRRRPCGVTPM